MQQMDRDRDREKKGDSHLRPNSLLDKQLDDILRTAERTHRRQLFWRRLRGTSTLVLGRARGRRGWTSGRLMLTGLGLCLLATIIGRALPEITALLITGGVILFISPVFMSFRRGGAARRDPQMWRGRVIDYGQDDPFRAGREWLQQRFRRGRGKPPGRPR